MCFTLTSSVGDAHELRQLRHTGVAADEELAVQEAPELEQVGAAGMRREIDHTGPIDRGHTVIAGPNNAEAAPDELVDGEPVGGDVTASPTSPS